MSKIQVDTIVDKLDTGAPSFPKGLNSGSVGVTTTGINVGSVGIATTGITIGSVGVTTNSINVSGIVSATTYYGDGSQLTGIAAGGGDRFTTITPNQTTGKTIVNKEFCLVTSAGVTITLPASPSAGAEVAVGVTTGITNTVIGRNSQNIMSLAEDMTIDIGNVVVNLVYSDSTRGWRIV